tara:strand:+ start:436 stop:594 length:159 start_codon:yes stop_codon:yes gene_type:complete
MHHTTNEIPTLENKFLWQKNHQENQTGTKNSHKPNTILDSKDKFKKYESWKN